MVSVGDTNPEKSTREVWARAQSLLGRPGLTKYTISFHDLVELIGQLCTVLDLMGTGDVLEAKKYACEVLGHLGHALAPSSMSAAEFIKLLARTVDQQRHVGPFGEPPVDLLEAKRGAVAALVDYRGVVGYHSEAEGSVVLLNALVTALRTTRDSAKASHSNDEYYRKAIGDRAQLEAREARAIEQERYLKTREEAVKRLEVRVQEREAKVRAEERRHEAHGADASIQTRVLNRQVKRLEKEVLELNREIATMEVTSGVENDQDDENDDY